MVNAENKNIVAACWLMAYHWNDTFFKKNEFDINEIYKYGTDI